MVSIWRWNWLFESFDMPAHLPKNCFSTASPRKSLLTKANWLEHFGSSWCENRHKYLPVNHAVSEAEEFAVRALTRRRRDWQASVKMWSSPQGQHGTLMPSNPTPWQSEWRQGANTRTNSAPACTSYLCQPWQPPHLYGLMRWLNSRVWHMLGKVSAGECTAFTGLTFFFFFLDCAC